MNRKISRASDSWLEILCVIKALNKEIFKVLQLAVVLVKQNNCLVRNNLERCLNLMPLDVYLLSNWESGFFR